MQSFVDHKLLWRSRRGMLELDLVLQPFVESIYNQLTDKQKSSFVELLQQDDPNLLAWLVYGEEPLDEFDEIVAIIRTQTKS